jgi:hypothetical protein
MKKLLALALTAFALVPCHASNRDDDESRNKAAEELLLAMKMDKNTETTLDQMIEVQIKQQPQIAPFKDVMRKFLMKHLNWESLKGDMIKLYSDSFTEPELKELTAFYHTPVGRKSADLLPQLSAKGAQIGMERVQKNLPELQRMIQEQAGGQK